MSYYNHLHPWCIIQCLPNAQTTITARFRRRSDAEAHLQVLRQLTPTAIYDLIFDVSENDIENNIENRRIAPYIPLHAARPQDVLLGDCE